MLLCYNYEGTIRGYHYDVFRPGCLLWASGAENMCCFVSISEKASLEQKRPIVLVAASSQDSRSE